jgi:hypothetical protein
MSEERLEVLKMVADKVITVEDAERLLRALDEGERKRSEPRRAEKRVGVVAGAFDGMGEALGAIGEVVEATIQDAVQGVGELGFDVDDLGDAAGPTRFELAAGAALSIRQHGRGSHRGACSLTLLPAEDGVCSVEAEPGADLRTRPDGDRAKIRWRRGALTVRVPPGLGEVEARLLGGELVAHGLSCPLEARTMGGRVEITGVRAPVDARVTGGDLVLGLARDLRGESRASAMGGAVVITVPEGLDARIEATSTGGEVRVDPGVGRVRREGHRLHGVTVVESGAEAAATIAVKSIGGEVVVKRESP